MNSNYRKAIKIILDFKRKIKPYDSDIVNKLKGELGEFYVLSELKKRGFNIEHVGGQGNYDILLKDYGKKIEVRTSVLKHEGVFPDDILYFGWKVKTRKQKKDKKFDYLICVALDSTFTKPTFYVFKYCEAYSTGDVNLPRFKNVQKKIYLFKNNKTYRQALKINPKIVTKFERYVNLNASEFLNKWQRLRK